MYGDPVFYNCMTFTEALGLDKSSECIRDGPLENLWGVGRSKYKKNIRTREN